jgi:acetylornithine deacetylase/succinyl-diaminopimelate desuccinylase-like protein
MKAVTCALMLAWAAGVAAAPAPEDLASRTLARELFKQLIEIDTSAATGSVTPAAEAMAARFRASGFAASDVQLVGDDPRKKNLVVRLRGTGRARPILLMGHLDVVDARREDWSTDPFTLIVKDGYYYGRGTQDMKDGDAIMVATLIRLKREGFSSSRDVILALTADEETSGANGIDWLVHHRRDLIDAEYALNHDGTGVDTDHGRPVAVNVGLTEKVYADFELTVLNRGGHSSEPPADNAIYELVAALGRLERHHFPFELNDAVRASYERLLPGAEGARAATLRGVVTMPPEPAAVARFDLDPVDYAQVHTTCVATRLAAGHANNALAQTATAIVNCRILPGHEPEDIREELIRVFAEPKLAVRYIDDFGVRHETAESKHGFAAPVVRRDLMRAVERVAAEMWPGTPVTPVMGSAASDAAMLAPAGIPVYAVSGDADDLDDHRAHGQDERLGVEAFDHGVDFYYRFLTTLLGARP